MAEALTFEVDVRVAPARQLHLAFSTRARAVGISGPSGAGKTTLLRALAGVEGRARGHVRFNGRTWLDTAAKAFVPPWHRRIGWVPQDSLLFPHRSVAENLAHAATAGAGAGTKNRVELADVLALLEIAHLQGRRPRLLSGGERQRVALGRALLSNPDLLLLDEPFSALDQDLREAITGRLRALCRDRDIPYVVVSHDTDAFEDLEAEHWGLERGALRRVP